MNGGALQYHQKYEKLLQIKAYAEKNSAKRSLYGRIVGVGAVGGGGKVFCRYQLRRRWRQFHQTAAFNVPRHLEWEVG